MTQSPDESPTARPTMTRTGYNAVACLAIVGAVVIAVAGADQKISEGLVLLAGIVVGRGEKS